MSSRVDGNADSDQWSDPFVTQLVPEGGAILSRKAVDAMEMRVMSVGCTDADFRKLMDSHESLRNCVAYFTQRTNHD